MRLIAGTRGSKLALAQTDLIIRLLKEKYPSLEIEKKIIKTKGDKILNRALDKIGDKGLFVKEIENQLISGQIDFAVHSLKDMPSDIDYRLKLTKTPNRADARDVLVINPKHEIKDVFYWLKNSKDLKIGTGSKRRSAQLLEINKNIEIRPIRGNIDTRIEKLVKEDYDAIVLAAAGLERLELLEKNKLYFFDYAKMIPAPGQGALAIEIRKDRKELDKIFQDISDEKKDLEVLAERAFLKEINGGCHIPVGAISEIKEGRLFLSAVYGSEDCSQIVKSQRSIEINEDFKNEKKEELSSLKNDKLQTKDIENEIDKNEFRSSGFCQAVNEENREKVEKIAKELAVELLDKIGKIERG